MSTDGVALVVNAPQGGAQPAALRDLLESSIEALDYELVHLEWSDRVLRVYIDAPGGILVEDCATVSRQLSAVLDVEDLLQSAYSLEVSSPGLDRPLAKPAHFQRFIGSRVRVVMKGYVLGRRRFIGKLLEADALVVVVEVDGESYELPYADHDSARLEPVF